MLEYVKLALRISGDDFDEEIEALINDCLLELAGLGVTANSDDAQVKTAVVAYCKWLFGDGDSKEQWRQIYESKLAKLKTMTNYTEWGGVNG